MKVVYWFKGKFKGKFIIKQCACCTTVLGKLFHIVSIIGIHCNSGIIIDHFIRLKMKLF